MCSAKLDDRLPEVLDFAKELQKSYEKVSILGYCWGKWQCSCLFACAA